MKRAEFTIGRVGRRTGEREGGEKSNGGEEQAALGTIANVLVEEGAYFGIVKEQEDDEETVTEIASANTHVVSIIWRAPCRVWWARRCAYSR